MSAAGLITEGKRDDTLHRHLLRAARRAHSFDEVLTEGRRFSEQHLSPPLPDEEVERTARSAWKCQIEGRNWVGSQGHVDWAVELVQMCAPHKHGGDAVILMTVLGAKHAKRKEAFAVVPRAMADHHVVAGWSEHRTRTALAAAVELDLIERVHEGGRFPGDPSLYRLVSYV